MGVYVLRAFGVMALTLGVGTTTGFGSNDFFWIINNTNPSDTATSGFFQGLEGDGSSLIAGGRTFYVYYNANADAETLAGGNDVLLTTVPEPSTVAMLVGLAGIGLLGYSRRRRRS